MKPTLPKLLFSITVFLFLASCVSKKKFSNLQDYHSVKSTEYFEKIDQLSNRNDSLLFVMAQKDSLLDSLNIRLAELQKKDKSKLKIVEYSKKKSSLSTEQEYDKKAVFLYNFSKYIEWPLEYNGTEFVIGIVGDAEVLAQLQKSMADKKTAGKKIIIKPYVKGPKYNLVYVTSSKSGSLLSVQKNEKRNKSVLISDEGKNHNIDGSHISFLIDNTKIRYFINKSAIESLGLKVAQELMRYAG
ncbi:MAG: YfiR family protein [Bacteroidota bacterium]|nr:YfiR family protein [Bacteroidota bacterium]